MNAHTDDTYAEPNDTWLSVFAKIVGDVLREVRIKARLSMSAVVKRLDGDLSAAAVGTYELGERAPTVERLRQLTDVYGTTPGAVISEVLKRLSNGGIDAVGWTVDLLAASTSADPQLHPLRRWAQQCLLQRSHRERRLVRLNTASLKVLAELCGISPHDMATRLPRPSLAVARDVV